MVLPARFAGLVMPEDDSASTPNVVGAQTVPLARIFSETVPLAWAWNQET